MGDGEETRHRLRFERTCRGFGPLYRPHAARICINQQTDEVRSEINFMRVWGERFETHAVIAKGSPNNAESSTPADVAALGDLTGRPAARVLEGTQVGWIAALTFVIELGWHSHPQGLMRSFVIIDIEPVGGAPLLACRCVSRRRGHFGFINSMHLLMGAIVLRPRSPSELDPDAQKQPPGRQARQVQRSITSKGWPMINANDSRFSISLKKRLKIPLNWLVPMGQQPDTQDEAAEQIAHGQWIDALAIARPKPPFEVDCPHVVASLWQGQSRPRLLWPTLGSTHPFADEVQPFEPSLNSALAGQYRAGMLSSKSCTNLFGTPARMPMAQLSQCLEPTVGSSVRAVPRLPRLIEQSRTTELTKAAQPFEASFAADFGFAAQLSHRFGAAQGGLNQALARLQQRRSFPRHGRRKTRSKLSKRNSCHVLLPSPMSCPRAGSLRAPPMHMMIGITDYCRPRSKLGLA